MLIPRPQNKDLSAERDTCETKFEDLSDQVEISLLDKEVAEERFEAAEGALETVKERVAELEVEVAVLRDENGELNGLLGVRQGLTGDSVARMEGAGEHELAHGGDEPRSSLAFVQLEKQNDRLKDALVRYVERLVLTSLSLNRIVIRLRDLTSETDAEQRRRISDLEKELDLTSDLQCACRPFSNVSQDSRSVQPQPCSTTTPSSSNEQKSNSRTSRLSSMTPWEPRTCSSS